MSFAIKLDEISPKDTFGLPENVLVEMIQSSPEVKVKYEEHLTALYKLWNQSETSVNHTADLVDLKTNDPAQYNITIAPTLFLVAHTRAMREIAQEGIDHDADPLTPNARVSQKQAVQMDLLLKTLRAVGFDLDADLSSVTVIKDLLQAHARWQGMAEAGNILHDLLFPQSLQALLETEYIQKGNDMIFGDMSQLREALSLTKKGLQTLTSLQDLHNQIKADLPTPPDELYQNWDGRVVDDNGTIVPSGTPGSHAPSLIWWYKKYGKQSGHPASESWWEPRWTGVLENYFKPIQVSVDESTGTTAELKGKIPQLKIDLENTIRSLREQRGESYSGYLGSAASPIASPEGTMETKLLQVYYDLGGSGGMSETAFANWVTDAYNSQDSFEDQGKMQIHLNDAILSAENLNDEQKEDLRRLLFLFEEYYKSAVALLTRISQIVEKMAANIAR